MKNATELTKFEQFLDNKEQISAVIPFNDDKERFIKVEVEEDIYAILAEDNARFIREFDSFSFYRMHEISHKFTEKVGLFNSETKELYINKPDNLVPQWRKDPKVLWNAPNFYQGNTDDLYDLAKEDFLYQLREYIEDGWEDLREEGEKNTAILPFDISKVVNERYMSDDQTEGIDHIVDEYSGKRYLPIHLISYLKFNHQIIDSYILDEKKNIATDVYMEDTVQKQLKAYTPTKEIEISKKIYQALKSIKGNYVFIWYGDRKDHERRVEVMSHLYHQHDIFVRDYITCDKITFGNRVLYKKESN